MYLICKQCNMDIHPFRMRSHLKSSPHGTFYELNDSINLTPGSLIDKYYSWEDEKTDINGKNMKETKRDNNVHSNLGSGFHEVDMGPGLLALVKFDGSLFYLDPLSKSFSPPSVEKLELYITLLFSVKEVMELAQKDPSIRFSNISKKLE